MTSSRVEKYRALRESLKDEAGINREIIMEDNDEVDDFLSFIPQIIKPNFNDTLVELKPYKMIEDEKPESIVKALDEVKTSVGRENFNTRLDILNKIRGHHQDVVAVQEVAKTNDGGVLVKPLNVKEDIKEPIVEEVVKEATVEEIVKSPIIEDVLENSLNQAKEQETKMTLMEKLALMSNDESKKNQDEIVNEDIEIYDHKSNESKVSKVIDMIIVALVVVFVVLCVMIVSQIIL